MGLWLRVFLVLTLSCTFAACGNQPTQASRKTLQQTPTNGEQQAARFLRDAANAGPKEKQSLMLRAAELFARIGNTDEARNVLSQIPQSVSTPMSPFDESYGRRQLVQSYIVEADGDNVLALELVNDATLTQVINQYPQELQVAVRAQRASLMFNLGMFKESLTERVELAKVIESEETTFNQNSDLIWETLMEFPQGQLRSLAEDTSDYTLRGWYSLAALSKTEQSNLREQLAKVDQWSAAWTGHPASKRLPPDLQLLRELLNSQPKQIAVLLPQTGKLAAAANAVRDGMLAAYYRQRQTIQQPQLRFYDTANADINQIYDQAIEDGADIVIGPLAKEAIAELALRPALPVPTLALNTVDAPLGVVPNLFQFGLGIEDEATQTADKLWRDGHRRILILAPEGNWGDRSIDTFSRAWDELGGTIAGSHRYGQSSEYAKLLKRALQLDESEARGAAIRNVVGDVKFEPRRRQDIDAIFLVANTVQARQLKPTLAFLYAGDIPVYATSQVYGGIEDPKLDQDLNGVLFTILPWYFEKRTVEKLDINNYASPNPGLQPLYALGVDIYHLYPRLRQLDQVDSARFYGQTGTLHMNDNGQVERRQAWAKFVSGRVREIRDTQ